MKRKVLTYTVVFKSFFEPNRKPCYPAGNHAAGKSVYGASLLITKQKQGKVLTVLPTIIILIISQMIGGSFAELVIISCNRHAHINADNKYLFSTK